MTKEVIHIGSLIEKELKTQERTVSWFAKKLSCDRSTIYRGIFQKQSIEASELFRISLILKTNFFEYYSSQYNNSAATFATLL